MDNLDNEAKSVAENRDDDSQIPVLNDVFPNQRDDNVKRSEDDSDKPENDGPKSVDSSEFKMVLSDVNAEQHSDSDSQINVMVQMDESSLQGDTKALGDNTHSDEGLTLKKLHSLTAKNSVDGSDNSSNSLGLSSDVPVRKSSEKCSLVANPDSYLDETTGLDTTGLPPNGSGAEPTNGRGTSKGLIYRSTQFGYHWFASQWILGGANKWTRNLQRTKDISAKPALKIKGVHFFSSSTQDPVIFAPRATVSILIFVFP